jgi:hypothetical protein
MLELTTLVKVAILGLAALFRTSRFGQRWSGTLQSMKSDSTIQLRQAVSANRRVDGVRSHHAPEAWSKSFPIPRMVPRDRGRAERYLFCLTA